MAALTDLKAILIYIPAALVVVLGLSTWEYQRMFKASDFALTTRNTAIRSRNDEAKHRLEQLTTQRDALQGQLDKRRTAQENSDGQAVSQIAADDRQQRSVPVRVRVLDCTRDAGPRGGGASGGAAPGAEVGATDASSASGLLPKEGARRLADALTEVEGVNAAYASERIYSACEACRRRSMQALPTTRSHWASCSLDVESAQEKVRSRRARDSFLQGEAELRTVRVRASALQGL